MENIMDVLRVVTFLLIMLLKGAWQVLRGLGRIIFAVILWLVRRWDFRARGALGTARWANAFELWWAGVYRGKGPVVGKGWFGRLMRFNSDGIVQVFAPPGAGKGVGIVIPTLLDYPGSVVVSDIKGENYAVTAGYRARLGRVLMLNPADLPHSARLNPMDMIRVSTDDEQDDARALADLMVVQDSSEGHWANKSRSLLSALILHALHNENPDLRTLSQVRRLSTGGEETIRDRITEIATASPSPLAQSIAEAFLGTMGSPESGLRNEFASVLSDLQKATEPFVEGTPTARLSTGSTFALGDLTGPETVSLYLCVDEEKLRAYGLYLRIIVGCTVCALTRAKYTARPRHKVLLLLDEVRALGRLDVLSNSLGFLRAYCTPVLIWQNMPQVRSLYGDAADEFLANSSCRVFFGVADNDTALQVSTACGQKQVRTQSEGISQQSDALVRQNRSEGRNDAGYWLIDPSEVQRLPVSRAIIKMRHVAFPILTGRGDYRRRLRWWFRWDRWMAKAPARGPAVVTDWPSGPPVAPSPRSADGGRGPFHGVRPAAPQSGAATL
jgi:type IV secretion system protein VirD4